MTTNAQKIRAGDTIQHRVNGELRYVAACDQEGRYVRVAGWPDSEAACSEFVVVEAASDEERLSMLRTATRSEGERAATAIRQLHESKACVEVCVMCEIERREHLNALDRAVLDTADALYADGVIGTDEQRQAMRAAVMARREARA